MHKHLVVSISGHGFGHVAQTAPILNALHKLAPKLRITVRSMVAAEHLRSRIQAPFTLLPSRGDIGMLMHSPFEVDVDNSRAAYQNFHANWDDLVREEAEILRELKADLVFSNVGYLPLAGAQRAGIPNVALCSLNWADIYRHCCGEDAISRQILSCYQAADAFLRTTPGMPMSDLTNLIPVLPIAAIGTNRRDELNQLLKLSQHEKLVLVSMGGITSRLPVEDWPRCDGIRYLVPANWQTQHPDAIVFDDLPMSFNDLLASSDALLSKPGYGSFVEAAATGVPLLYVGRPDWPESPALIEWLQCHGACREISHNALIQGNIADELDQLWNATKPAQVIPCGAEQVARCLAEKLV